MIKRLVFRHDQRHGGGGSRQTAKGDQVNTQEEGGRKKEHSLTPLSKGIITRRTLGKARAIH